MHLCILAGTFIQSNSLYIQNFKMFLNQNAASLGIKPRPVEHAVLNLHLASLTIKTSIVNQMDIANDGQPL